MKSSTDVYLCRSAWGSWGGHQGDDSQLLKDLEGPGYSDSGVVVNQYTALSHNPVWSAVSRIMFDIAKSRLFMYERLDHDRLRGARQLAKHPTQMVVSRKANERMSAYRFWATYVFHLLLWNKAYAYLEFNAAGQVVAMYNLPPDTTYPLWNAEREQYDAFITNINGREVPLYAFEVLDCVGPQYDEANVLDITELAAANWGVGMAGTRFMNEFFANGSHSGGIIEVPAETTPGSAENLIEMIERRNRGLGNAFKYMLLRDGAKFHQTTVRPIDAQMAELLMGNVRDVARWYKMPPSKLGAAGEGSAYGNREQDARDYVEGTLDPWMCNITDQCWLKLLTTDAQRNDRYEFEHDTSKLLATDMLTQVQVIEVAIRTGLMSPDEGRAYLGLNPRGDKYGSMYYYSNNMQPAVDEPEPEPKPTEPPPDLTPTPGNENDPPPTDEERAKRELWKIESLRIGSEYRTKAKWHRTRRGAEFRAWWGKNWNKVAEPYMDMLSARAMLLCLFDDAEGEAAAVLAPIAREMNDNDPLT